MPLVKPLVFTMHLVRTLLMNLRVGEGAKGLLNQGSEKPLAPVQPGVAPAQPGVADGARDPWETFAPWVGKTLVCYRVICPCPI